MSKAIEDVLAERKRQVDVEGWTTEHDDEHTDGEMAQAAAVYAHPLSIQLAENFNGKRHKDAWPWHQYADLSGGRGDCPSWGFVRNWFKPKDRRRDLIRAAALIIAEIERLDRASSPSTPS